MSGQAMKWAMNLRRAEIPDPQARAVLMVFAWMWQGAPLFASVAHLSNCCSLDSRTVRRALAWLEQRGFIRATGKLHRNMKFYEVGPLPVLSGFNDSGLLTETSVVHDARPLAETPVVEAADPSHPRSRPLTFLQPTPDKNVSRKRLRNIEKVDAPAVIQEQSADAMPLAQPIERGSDVSRASVAESLKLLRSKVIR